MRKRYAWRYGKLVEIPIDKKTNNTTIVISDREKAIVDKYGLSRKEKK